MAKQLFEIMAGGGEGPETNSFGSEYIVSIAPVGPATMGDGSGDYGIWTSAAGPEADAAVEAADDVRPKKAA